MKSATFLKILSVILFIFALGHTLGTSAPQVRRGPAEAAVFSAMQSYRFPVMGFTRSYWDFYRGLAITVGILMFALAAIAWQLALIAQRHGSAALPIAITVLLACTGMLVIAFEFLFTIPIVFSAVTVVLAGAAVVVLLRRMRRNRSIADELPLN
ncbi:MAG TPA: hypothetical protein VGR95_12375 [Thermoanaerobaculia bacterium]|nr:hypothetical protein [Thermoanaerobaculia bacterium]